MKRLWDEGIHSLPAVNENEGEDTDDMEGEIRLDETADAEDLFDEAAEAAIGFSVYRNKRSGGGNMTITQSRLKKS